MSNETPTPIPEPKVKTDPEFEAMFKEAQVAYPDMPQFLLRIALMNAVRDEDLKKAKKLPKKSNLLDKATDPIEADYIRTLPEDLTITGIEVIPPTEISEPIVVEA